MALRFKARSRSSALARVAVAAAIVALAGGMVPLSAESDSFAVVASVDVPVENLTLGELRSIFMFRKRYWAPGRQVTVVFGDESLSSGSLLLEKVYGMDYPSLRRMILEKLYQGELDLAPKVVATDRAVIAYVGHGHGSIGWVRVSALPPEPHDSIKVLTVDGKGYGDEGYPLIGR